METFHVYRSDLRLKWQYSPNSFTFSAIPIKISAVLFAEINKLILKFIWKCKGSRIVKTILEKNKVGQFILPDFKTYYVCIF